MTTTEKIELALISMVTVFFAFEDQLGPAQVSAGYVVLFCSGALLVQSLLRDLWLLIAARREPFSGTPREAQCMCVESAVGLVGVLIAGLLVGSGFSEPICMYDGGWGIFLLPTLLVGFLLKDYVLEWNPWRIRREKDHPNIIFRWRK